MVSLAGRGGAEGECVGAGVRLAHPVGAYPLTAAEPGHVFPLGRLGAVLEDRHLDAPHLRGQAEQEPVVPAPIPQRFHGQDGGHDVVPRPAQFLGEGQALDPELAALLPELVGEGTGAVPGDQVVLERFLGEFNDGLAEFELLR